MAAWSATELQGALTALTTRGRCFVAAGATSSLAGLLLGEHDLVRIGVLLIALPLAAVLTVARSRYRLSCTRVLEPSRIGAGEQTTVTLRLTNLSRLPTSVLLVEDQLPRALGTAPRFVLDRLPAGQQRAVAYRVRSRIRGIWRVGPLSVRLADPFGFCELARSFAASDRLVVTPAITPLPSFRVPGDRTSGGEGLAAALALGSDDDVGTRPYREGDDLRRVHWRTTARTGELSVRQESLPWQARATVLLDTRASVSEGVTMPESATERAVAAAASVAVALARGGFALRLVDAAGRVRVSAPAATAEAAVLTELAGIACEDQVVDLAGAALALAAAPGTLVAVLVRPSPATVVPLAPAASRAGGRARALALVVGQPPRAARASAPGQAAFSPAASPPDAATAGELLAAAGWSVATTADGARLGELWPELLHADAARAGARQ